MFEDEPLEFLPLEDLVEENMADNIDLEEDWGELWNPSDRPTVGVTSQQKAALRFAFTLGNSSSMPGQSTSMDVPSIDNPRINGSDFRMNSSLLSSSGALMLGSSIDLISSSFASSLSLNSAGLDLLDRAETKTTVELGMALPTSPLPHYNPMDFNMMNDAYSDDGEAPDLGDIYRGEPNGDSHPGASLGAGVDGDDNDSETTVRFNVNRDELAQKEVAVAKEDKKILKTLVNPWLMHDPHSPGTTPSHPFRKGKPFRIPKKTGLLDTLVAKVKKEESELDAAIAGITLADLNLNLSKPFMPEFSYIYDGEMKRKAAERLKKRREALVSAAAERGVLVDETQLKMKELEEQEADDGAADLLLSFGRSAGESAPVLDDPYRWNFDVGGGDVDEDDYGVDIGGDVYRGEDLPKSSSNLFGAAVDQGEEQLSYEEHCRRRLEEYFRSAQQQIQETELSSRIDEWGAKLAPLLKDQESRSPFDIHVYGTRLINGFHIEDEDSLTHASEPVCASLQELLISDTPDAQPPPAYEVSRAFSSMLQLANMGNVKIMPTRNAEGLHDITLQLLSTVPGVVFDHFAQEQPNGDSHTEPTSNGTKTSRSKVKRKGQ